MRSNIPILEDDPRPTTILQMNTKELKISIIEQLAWKNNAHVIVL